MVGICRSISFFSENCSILVQRLANDSSDLRLLSVNITPLIIFTDFPNVVSILCSWLLNIFIILNTSWRIKIKTINSLLPIEVRIPIINSF